MSFEQVTEGVSGGARVLVENQKTLIKNTRFTSPPKVVLFGDSFTWYQKRTDTNAVAQQSAWHVALAELGEKINIVAYSGVGGDPATAMQARLQTDVLDHSPDLVFGQVGVNDFYGYDRTAVEVFATVSSMITSILDSGSKVVWLNCVPQPAARSGFTAAKSLESAKYNNLLGEWAKDVDGVTVVDIYSELVDRNDTTNGVAKRGIGADNIHLNLQGAASIARLVVPAVEPYLPSTSSLPLHSPMVAGDIGTANFSNFSGTGGGVGTGCSGDVPDGWFLIRASGDGTAVGAMDSDGWSVTATKAVATQTRFDINSGNIYSQVVGDETLQATLISSIETTGNLQIEEVRLRLYHYDGVALRLSDWGRTINSTEPTDYYPTIDMLMSTHPRAFEVGDNDVGVSISITCSGVGGFVLRPKSMKLMDVS